MIINFHDLVFYGCELFFVQGCVVVEVIELVMIYNFLLFLVWLLQIDNVLLCTDHCFERKNGKCKVKVITNFHHHLQMLLMLRLSPIINHSSFVNIQHVHFEEHLSLRL